MKRKRTPGAHEAQKFDAKSIEASMRPAPPAAIRNSSVWMAMLTLKQQPWLGESDRAELGRDVKLLAGGAKAKSRPMAP